MIFGIDLYKLSCDGSGKMERLTRFVYTPGNQATNPVVSDDGRFIAFQIARKGGAAWVGRGIFLFDVGKYEAGKLGEGDDGIAIGTEGHNRVYLL